MDSFITLLIVLGIICICSLILLTIIYLFFVLRDKYKKKYYERLEDIDVVNISNSPTVENCLDTISSSSKGKTIAASFLSLVSLSYILIHILVNEGEKYSDKVQKKDYCNSLSPDLIEHINSVEGKYE